MEWRTFGVSPKKSQNILWNVESAGWTYEAYCWVVERYSGASYNIRWKWKLYAMERVENTLYRCSHNQIHCQSDIVGMLPPMWRPRSYNKSKRRKSKQRNEKRNGKLKVFLWGIQIKCSSCSCISDPGTCKVCISCKAKIRWGTSLETSENWTGTGECWIICDVLVYKRLWLSPDKSAERCP